MLLAILLLSCSYLFLVRGSNPNVVMETSNSAILKSWNNLGRADPSTLLDLIFYVKEKNMDVLTKLVEDISNPGSPNYGKHLTKADLEKLTSNTQGVDRLSSFLRSIGANITTTSANGLRITAIATVSVWEAALSCKFSKYQKANGSIQGTYIRTTSYSLPSDLAGDISMVVNTINLPSDMGGGPIRVGPSTNLNLRHALNVPHF